ncbi:MAG: glycosyltransferase family 1 protein [Deltaproteobacteria bacterium]|nr:glycosyltransferase family 1 protein [Deltaproteobacteria bacterium]
MRILALKAKGYVLPAIHDSMVRAFQSRGIEVLDLPLPQNHQQYKTLREISRSGYDAVFTLDPGAKTDFTLNIKELQLSIKIPWIIWFVDDPEGYGFPDDFDPDWTLAFCWDGEISQGKFPWKGRMLAHLPLAADPSVFWPERANSDLLYPGGVFVGSTAHSNVFFSEVFRNTPGLGEDVLAVWRSYQKDFSQPLHNLAWMALAPKINHEFDSIRTEPLSRLWVKVSVYYVGMIKRKEIVTKVIKLGGGVFGDGGWTNLVDKGVYLGRVFYGDELRKVYGGSAFTLDVRQPQSRSGLTQRVFDASACGCPVLSECSPELEDLFAPEEEIMSFRNLEEALEMKKLYLQDSTGAQKKGEKARQKVLAKHTYRHRVEEIIKALHKFF